MKVDNRPVIEFRACIEHYARNKPDEGCYICRVERAESEAATIRRVGEEMHEAITYLKRQYDGVHKHNCSNACIFCFSDKALTAWESTKGGA